MSITFENSKRAESARKYFSDGYNCAQAVVLAFEDILPLDKEGIALMSSPFAFWEGWSLYLERVDRRPLQKISQPDAFLYLLQYAKEGVKGMDEPTLRQMLCADFTQGENKNPPAFLRTE